MADVRIPSGAPSALPARPLPAARAEAIKAAQRAFFNPALAGGVSAASAPSAPQAVAPAPSATRLDFDTSAPAPRAPLRPGSLLDIKV